MCAATLSRTLSAILAFSARKTCGTTGRGGLTNVAVTLLRGNPIAKAIFRIFGVIAVLNPSAAFFIRYITRAEMAVFLVILLVGYVYVWRKGVLNWDSREGL